MCAVMGGLVSEVAGLNTLYQGKKNVDEAFGWNKKEKPTSTTNIYNYGSDKETTKTPNRASLNTEGSSKSNTKGGTY